MYEPAPQYQPGFTTREKWHLFGKVIASIGLIAAIVIFGMLYFAMLPLHLAVFKQRGRHPKHAGEAVAVASLSALLWRLWRERAQEEKAYERGVAQGLHEAARLQGRRDGKAAGLRSAWDDEPPY